MSSMIRIVALVYWAPAWALKTRGSPSNSSKFTVVGDYIYDIRHLDARPGSPAVPVAPDDPVLQTLGDRFEPWRRELGERLLKAASAHDAMQKCGSFMSLADYTWCRHAMPAEGDPGFRRAYGHVHEYDLRQHPPGGGQAPRRHFPAPGGLAALSYGIQGGDVWSEFMSGMYFLKTDLFDCYFDGAGPGPIPNDLHKGHSRNNSCRERKCYTEEYTVHKVCLDDSTQEEEVQDALSGRRFQSLAVQLRNRGPLSTFLKMDIEGSEWPALERLVSSEADMAKIRTLDMEVHFQLAPRMIVHGNGSMNMPTGIHRPEPTREELTRNVEIMERLAEHFAVTGSTIAADFTQAERIHYTRKPYNLQRSHAVVTEQGFRLDQYAISFVNRRLL